MRTHHSHYLAVILVSLIFIFGIFYTDLAFGKQRSDYSSRPMLLASNRVGTFVFNPRAGKYYAISHSGRVIKQGRASGGRNYCPDIRRSCRTPSGVYRIHSKGGPGCRSSRYPVGRGGAPMPYCMFFSRYYAVHGSYDVPNHNASHGCVRVRPSDASWLHKNMGIGAKVVIKPY